MIKSSCCPFRGPNVSAGSQLLITTAPGDLVLLAFEGICTYIQTHTHIIANNKNKKVNVFCVFVSICATARMDPTCLRQGLVLGFAFLKKKKISVYDCFVFMYVCTPHAQTKSNCVSLKTTRNSSKLTNGVVHRNLIFSWMVKTIGHSLGL